MGDADADNQGDMLIVSLPSLPIPCTTLRTDPALSAFVIVVAADLVDVVIIRRPVKVRVEYTLNLHGSARDHQSEGKTPLIVRGSSVLECVRLKVWTLLVAVTT